MKQLEGYRAFIPSPLPPDPPVELAGEIAELLSRADRALGRLDGAASVLPNPDLFVAMYVRQEAVLSSQIEGTQSSLGDVLEFEVDASSRGKPQDVEEVVNYVAAMNHGLARLDTLPLSLRLIREIHAKLVEDARGADRTPGEFRRSQNWIGPTGCTLTEAVFVPPPVHEMNLALGDLERFLRDTSLPALIHCGLAHAQFETIHPFLDGNGRVGRLLITLLLCQRDILRRPLLYLSLYLKMHRAEYYDRLMAVRTDGHWEAWLKFFLNGVYEVSRSATETARSILQMREQHRHVVAQSADCRASVAPRLLDVLFQSPLVSASWVSQRLGCSFSAANGAIHRLVDMKLLTEVTGRPRNRLFRYEPYLALFDNLTLPGPADRQEPDDAAPIASS